jgi:hypothetical protein
MEGLVLAIEHNKRLISDIKDTPEISLKIKKLLIGRLTRSTAQLEEYL